MVSASEQRARRTWREFSARVIEHVREIPIGCVSTYGDIDRRSPRRVGYVLATTREELPWHRVVRSDGSVALGAEQLQRLRREGVPMRKDRVDLGRARYTAHSRTVSLDVGRRGRPAPRSRQRPPDPGSARRGRGNGAERDAPTFREALRHAVAGVPGVIQRPSRWAGGLAYFVGDREIVHVHRDGSLDVRLTRALLREKRVMRTLDPRLRTRGPSSEWAAVSASDPHDLPFVVALVEEAARANG